jgi:hypothetical protein
MRLIVFVLAILVLLAFLFPRVDVSAHLFGEFLVVFRIEATTGYELPMAFWFRASFHIAAGVVGILSSGLHPDDSAIVAPLSSGAVPEDLSERASIGVVNLMPDAPVRREHVASTPATCRH